MVTALSFILKFFTGVSQKIGQEDCRNQTGELQTLGQEGDKLVARGGIHRRVFVENFEIF